jgi:hypothetical protein
MRQLNILLFCICALAQLFITARSLLYPVGLYTIVRNVADGQCYLVTRYKAMRIDLNSKDTIESYGYDETTILNGSVNASLVTAFVVPLVKLENRVSGRSFGRLGGARQ